MQIVYEQLPYKEAKTILKTMLFLQIILQIPLNINNLHLNSYKSQSQQQQQQIITINFFMQNHKSKPTSLRKLLQQQQLSGLQSFQDSFSSKVTTKSSMILRVRNNDLQLNLNNNKYHNKTNQNSNLQWKKKHNIIHEEQEYYNREQDDISDTQYYQMLAQKQESRQQVFDNWMKQGSGIFGKMVQGVANDKYRSYHPQQKQNVYNQHFTQKNNAQPIQTTSKKYKKGFSIFQKNQEMQEKNAFVDNRKIFTQQRKGKPLINVHNSDQLTFKALQYKGKRLSFMQIANQYSSQQVQQPINQEYYSNNFHQNKRNQKNLHRKSNSSNTPSLIARYQQSQNTSQLTSDYEYEFPQYHSPSRHSYSPIKRHLNYETNQKKNQYSYSDTKLSRIKNQLQQSLQIPQQFRNFITKGQYDSLTKQFQQIKLSIIQKIQSQVGSQLNGKSTGNVESIIKNVCRAVQCVLNQYDITQMKKSRGSFSTQKSHLNNTQTQEHMNKLNQSLNNIRQSLKFKNNEKLIQLQMDKNNPNLFSFDERKNDFKSDLKFDQELYKRDTLSQQQQEKKFQKFIQSEKNQKNQVLAKQEPVNNQDKKQTVKQQPFLMIQQPQFTKQSESDSSLGMPQMLQSMKIPLQQKKTSMKIKLSKVPCVESKDCRGSQFNLNNQLGPFTTTLFTQSVQPSYGTIDGITPISIDPNYTPSKDTDSLSRNRTPSEIQLEEKYQSKYKAMGGSEKPNMLKKPSAFITPLEEKAKNEVQQSQLPKSITFSRKESGDYNLHYAIRILETKDKKTQIVRVSPLKIRKKEQIINNLVENKIISKPSDSIIYE